MGTTLAEKVWADHLVRKGSDGAPDLLYIDLMLMHEVTSPQAFEGLRLAGRKPRHVDQLIATEDHNTPTVDIDRPNPDETSALQLTTLEKNCKEFGVRLHPLGDADQGIVHAFAPILGLTQPGMTGRARKTDFRSPRPNAVLRNTAKTNWRRQSRNRSSGGFLSSLQTR